MDEKLIEKLKFENELLKKEIFQIREEYESAYSQLKAANDELWEKNNELINLYKLLQISEEKYRVLIEASNDLIFSFDEFGTFIFVNSAYAKTIAKTPEEIINRSIFEIFPGKEGEFRWNLIKDIFITGKPKTFDVSFKINGEDYFFITTAKPVILPNNNKIIICISKDITERKHWENALIKAKEEADIANKIKTRFLANMSHEIRTPLNGLLGMAELLSMTELNDEQKKYINIMRYSSDILLSVINSILDISKIESGKIELEEVEFDFIKLVKDIYASFEHKAKSKNINFTLNINSKFKNNYYGDKNKIRQILINLIDNAIKFTEKGSVSITVEILSENKQENIIKIEISDTGIGIPESHFKNLFTHFYQINYTSTRKYGGTGLGLAITKSLIDFLNGTIKFKSTENIGTTFYLTLPIKNISKVSIKKYKDFLKLPLENLTEKHILLVEDNPINRDITKTMLNSLFDNIDIATNGKEAINKVLNKKYDIILMDIEMPELDGISATIEIRNIEEYKNIPIIAITAYSSKNSSEKCKLAGIDDIIIKPFSQKELLSKIKLLL